MSGVTSNGSLWIVSPGRWRAPRSGRAVAARQSARPISARVIGRPTSLEKPSTSLDHRARLALEHELHEHAVGDLLAVKVGVSGRRGGEPVVHGMRRRQAGRFEAQAGEQRVGLDQTLERRGDDLRLARRAAPRRRRRSACGSRALPVPRRCGSRRRRACSSTWPGDAGPGLEPGRQRIAHAGHQQARRRRGDHLRVDQHQVGVLAIEAVLLERRRRRCRSPTGRCTVRRWKRPSDSSPPADRGRPRRRARCRAPCRRPRRSRRGCAAHVRPASTRAISASEHSPPKRCTACWRPDVAQASLPRSLSSPDTVLPAMIRAGPSRPSPVHLVAESAVASLPWVYRLGELKTESMVSLRVQKIEEQHALPFAPRRRVYSALRIRDNRHADSDVIPV